MQMRNLACLLLCCCIAAFLQQELLAQGRLEKSSEVRVRNPVIYSGKTQKVKPKRTAPFKFEISIDPRRDYLGYYQEDRDLSIKCLFKNVSDKKQDLYLKDHDPFFGDLYYPSGLSARVWDTQGTLLTKTKNVEDGWWTNPLKSARGYMVQPGDTITLRPGEQVVRLVPLDMILDACPNLPRGFVAGKYTIQFRLFDDNDGFLSNKLEFEVRGKEIGR